MNGRLIAVLACMVLFSNPALAEDIEGHYKKACITCHGTGVLGAPKKGDRTAWAPRLAKGMPTLLSHVKGGFNNMPAKGLCNDCTDADYQALIQFMSQ